MNNCFRASKAFSKLNRIIASLDSSPRNSFYPPSPPPSNVVGLFDLQDYTDHIPHHLVNIEFGEGGNGGGGGGGGEKLSNYYR